MKLQKYATFGPLILNVTSEETLEGREKAKCSFRVQLFPGSKKRKNKLQQIRGAFLIHPIIIAL